ncbi:hypothetical protein [Aegicerativicinus sediminis]|uniref:hypothetical protein n=1 Tax=Aegicerativicinus sediminis TaxID=2893202 RepID=UPI001E36812D|nr:hypothetical protein [Aegicerativicinus sediminis]
MNALKKDAGVRAISRMLGGAPTRRRRRRRTSKRVVAKRAYVKGLRRGKAIGRRYGRRRRY